MTTMTRKMASTTVSLQALLDSPGEKRLPVSLHADLQQVAALESLPARSENLYRLLVDLADEGDEHLPALVSIWHASRGGDPAALRLLSSLLEVRQSGVALLQRMARPSQTVRACLHARHNIASTQRAAIADRAQPWMSQLDVTADSLAEQPGRSLEILHQEALLCLQRLRQGDLPASRLLWLRELVETEMQARARRLEGIAEKIGAYDGRRIARVLPYLTRSEESIRDTRLLLARWPHTEEMDRRHSALLQFLEERHFLKWTQALEAMPPGRDLARAFRLLRARTPDTRPLLFASAALHEVASLSHASELDPARCLLVALENMHPDGSLILETTARMQHRLDALVARLKLEPVGPGIVRIQYEGARHHALMTPDGSPAFGSPSQGPMDDIRHLVLDNIQNEHILSGLLNNPRVLASPGLVESVVHRSRSIKILLDIASRRDLHSGVANRNVPLALLTHPANIPISALRKFVHVRYVDRFSLAAMANRGTRARPEVRGMVVQYLKSIETH